VSNLKRLIFGKGDKKLKNQIHLQILNRHICPLECGGTLYRITPGIIVNIKGQNLASVEASKIGGVFVPLPSAMTSYFYNLNKLTTP
jgi:hypothetical protein